MSSLSKNDARLHYEDGSHRWTDPDDPDGDESWRAMVEAHIAEHRKALRRDGHYGDTKWPGRLRKPQRDT